MRVLYYKHSFSLERENTHTMNSISESRDHGVENGGDC